MKDLSGLATVILALSTFDTSVGAMVISFMNNRSLRVNTAMTAQNSVRIEEVHVATNGMKTELVEEVRKASLALGRKEEQDNPTPDSQGHIRSPATEAEMAARPPLYRK